jgi:hypothetical protein
MSPVWMISLIETDEALHLSMYYELYVGFL